MRMLSEELREMTQRILDIFDEGPRASASYPRGG